MSSWYAPRDPFDKLRAGYCWGKGSLPLFAMQAQPWGRSRAAAATKPPRSGASIFRPRAHPKGPLSLNCSAIAYASPATPTCQRASRINLMANRCRQRGGALLSLLLQTFTHEWDNLRAKQLD
jgi:hypothetical protein